MKLLFKYATRGRPKWFRETLEKYYSMLSRKHEFQFIVSMDTDDETMNTPEIRDYLAGKENLCFFYGSSKSKIQAINADMTGADFDILIVVSDDMVPAVQGFDDIIVQDMQLHFPDLDGTLHYNDGAHAGKQLIVLSIMGRPFYDRFGYIYWPEYVSMWCDNEFTDLAYGLNKAVWIDKVVIRHEFMKNGTDALYTANNRFWDQDKTLYKTRKAAGFPNAFNLVHK